MDISRLLGEIRRLPEYHQLLEGISERSLGTAASLSRASRPAVAAALAHDLDRPILYLVSRADRALSLREEFKSWSPSLSILNFPDPEPLFYEQAAWSLRTRGARASVLGMLARECHTPNGDETHKRQPAIILSTARGAMTRTLSRDQLGAHTHNLHVGHKHEFESLVRALVSSGYSHSNIVTSPGEFSRRGGIIDVWPTTEKDPVRLEFFGDEIDSMRSFDPSSQRSISERIDLCIPPAREGLPDMFQDAWLEWLVEPSLDGINASDQNLEYFLPLMNPSPTGLIDHLPDHALILYEDRAVFESVIEEIELQAIQTKKDLDNGLRTSSHYPLPYLTLSEVTEAISSHPYLDMGFGLEKIEVLGVDFSERFTPGPRFGGQLDPITEFILDNRIAHETVVVVSRQAQRLAELWSEVDDSTSVTDSLPDELLPGDVYFLQGPLAEGWTLNLEEGSRLHLLTDAELFGWSRPKPRRRTRPHARTPEDEYSDLKGGDVVVHVDYGIGKFVGLVQRTLGNVRREYLLVEYRDGDELFVPIHQADRLTRYIGAEGRTPSYSRLGGREWERTKKKISEAVEVVAKDLLELYAARQTVSGIAFPPDTPWQQELESSFPYAETDDQIIALNDVKRDMERPMPMDRLICGDVGYGKTEVAVRAAFKAAMGSKQVGMLVPTTVLAQQHYQTFKRRLTAFPVEVEMLSRFRTPSESRGILRRLAVGEIDIIIGTHRLLQSDVVFKDLGLLIVDEEQRFGVTHKEFLKKMRTQVDVLTLTATPIPRTLYMAITGVRDISTISTPPEERLPVKTYVGTYNPRVVRSAVLREMERGGQVFFVHNRVQTIETIRKRLEDLIPEATFVVAHGQMREQELSAVMNEFTSGEVDVLVSTSIIESGLDIPNANTLIVDRADRFGLAQLYQLRGRVGRAAIQAYAYFFRYTRGRTTEEAFQRLETIAEHSQLGAGYSIAMRDLEMRGAGDILGTRQHGHISAVGFHLYTRLLAHAVRRLRERHDMKTPAGLLVMEDLPPASIELPLAAAIPEEYVPERNLRLQLYRRLAGIRSIDELRSFEAELGDRFGPPPVDVGNLTYLVQIKILAMRAGVDSVTTENGKILIRAPSKDYESSDRSYGKDIYRSKRGYWIPSEGEIEWKVRLQELLNKLSNGSPDLEG
jgi:transcription-repair coupling factor (superfamily II helicase)